MRLMLSALLLAGASLALDARPADACGVPPRVMTAPARKAVKPSLNPSRVLIVGNPPARLERDLTQAGHKVATSAQPDAAPADHYAIVIVDSSAQADAARKRFPNSVIIQRSGNATV